MHITDLVTCYAGSLEESYTTYTASWKIILSTCRVLPTYLIDSSSQEKVVVYPESNQSLLPLLHRYGKKMDVRTAATLAHLIKDLSLKFLQELQTALNVHHVQPKKFSGQVDHNTQSQTSSKLNQVQEQVNDVKVIIKDNINKVLERGERLDDLIGKTDDLQATADSFQRTSTRVSRKFWWKNMKMMIIIGVVVLIVIILIILLATGVIPS